MMETIVGEEQQQVRPTDVTAHHLGTNMLLSFDVLVPYKYSWD